MKIFPFHSVLCSLFSVILLSSCQSKEERFVNRLMRQMTYEEKLGQLNLLPVYGEIVTGATVGEYDLGDRIAKGEVGGLFNLKGVNKIREAQRIAVEKSRLGIPLIFGMDVIHGYETVFPIPLAQSCSWDTAMIRQAAAIAAKESTADGLCWTFSPMVDICLDARWGRMAEGSGEDPFLGAAIAQAMVQGYQGKDLTAPNTMMACVKHFALYGAVEAGREYNMVDMSTYRMANDFMPPYKAAVDAGCGSVMAAFNTVNGMPCHCNQWLLTDVLRHQWGFDGFVVSDYTGVKELVEHGMGADAETVGARALQAGCDMDMASGALSIQQNRKAVDTACRRVLLAKYRLGLFDDPYRYCDTTRPATDIYTTENRALARQLATESFVLLKNTPAPCHLSPAPCHLSPAPCHLSPATCHLSPVTCHLSPATCHLSPAPCLPLSPTAKVALIGPLADTRTNMPGTWSVAATFDRYRTLREAFAEVLPKGHLFYAKGSNIFYDAELEARGSMFGRDIRDARSAEEMRHEAIQAAKQADVIVLALGETSELSGECTSRTDLMMPDAERELIDALASLGKPMVLLHFSGRPVILTHEDAICDAILQVWFGGSETADAVTDVVFGKVSPSGKLTTSFPRSVGQEPLFYRQQSTGRPSVTGQFEKFLTCYIDEANTPLYPFGYGLSYTTFDYTNYNLSPTSYSPVLRFTDSPISQECVSVTLTNSGAMAGAEVVQLYIRAHNSTLARPMRELRGFKRVYLQPGESQEVSFTISEETLGYYNEAMQFVVEPGPYDIYINDQYVDSLIIHNS